MLDVWDKTDQFVIAGGKLIDWICNKPKEESKNDYDIYQVNEEADRHQVIKLLSKGKAYGANGTAKSFPHLIEFECEDGYKYQIMNVVCDSPEDTIGRFDFRCCAICTNGKFIWWAKGALQDIKHKRLVMLNPHDTLNHFLRIQKYIQKGFTISCPDFLVASIKSLKQLINLHGKRDYYAEKYGPIINDRYYVYDRESFMYEDQMNNEVYETEVTEVINPN